MTLTNNYRPTSLISHLAQVVERNWGLITALNLCKILSQNQYGFRENSTTEDAILVLTSNMNRAFNSSLPYLCAFIDLSKAFDRGSHRSQSLSDMGVRNNKLDIFELILARKQLVKVTHALSDETFLDY